MPITDWPLEDRPREKLLNKGEQVLTDAELIAIFFKTGIKDKTALDIAKELLREYGGLKPLLQASPTCLMNKPGIGPAKYATLKAAIELGLRYHNHELPPGTLIKDHSVATQYLIDHLRHLSHEVFACLFIDSQLKLISFEILFHGTINESTIYPREIVKRGLFHHAVNVILAHNHPSGHCLPSLADKDVTVQIQQALALVDIKVIDHIIVAHSKHFSFAETGLI